MSDGTIKATVVVPDRADRAVNEAESFKALYLAERRDDRRAGALFAKACAEGDPYALLAAADEVNATVSGWTEAMKRVAQLDSVSESIKRAFLTIWIESKNLPLSVGNRPIMAKALRVLMPGTYSGPALRLYRGTTDGERHRRLYGFSWTTRLEIARDKFAERDRGSPAGAVVLETIAPPEAILLVLEDEDYYDEGEVVDDPFRLGRVNLLARITRRGDRELRRWSKRDEAPVG